MAERSAFVLDTFALLAYLQDEAGTSRVESLLKNAANEKCHIFVSIINLGEMLYIIERRGGVTKSQDALALIRQLPIEVLPADEQAVFDAAHIKAGHTLSYADAFAVVATIRNSAVLLTSDSEFESVLSLIDVEWLKK